MVETTTPRYGLPQWSDPATDAPDMADFNAAFAALDAAPIDAMGTVAARPGPGVPGRYYYATDNGLLYRDDGTAWRTVGGAEATAAPAASTRGAAAVGTATRWARQDHHHTVTTAAPTPSAPGDVAADSAAGSTALAAADHRHAREAFGTPVASAPGDTTAAGAAPFLARSDHVHGREAAVTPSPTTPVVTASSASAVGVETAWARGDHRHGFSSGTPGASAPGDAAAQGVATALSRSDHRHGREPYAAPGPSAPGDAAAEGSAQAVARADHVHGREAAIIVPAAAATTPAQADTTTGQVGTAATYARADHRHQVTYGTPGALAIGDTAAAGTAAMLARSDHSHAMPLWGSVGPVTTAADARNNGTSPNVAHADHVHGREGYGTPGSSGPADSAAAGSATSVARSDHRHGREGYGTPAASTPGDTAAAGTATSVARSDHVHGRESAYAATNQPLPSSALLADYPTAGAGRIGIFQSTAVVADGYPFQGTLVTFKRSDNYGWQELVERLADQSDVPRHYARAATTTGFWTAWRTVGPEPVPRTTKLGGDALSTYPLGMSYYAESDGTNRGWPTAAGILTTVRDPDTTLWSQQWISGGVNGNRIYIRGGSGTGAPSTGFVLAGP